MVVDDWDGSLGTVAARLRHATGLTQEQLAERSGLSVRAISSIECGARHPRRFTLERLGVGLGLTADERVSLVDLADRTRTGAVPARTARTGARPGQVPLVGRGAELAAVRSLLWGPEPGLLVFSGEPGVGKSRLLAEAGRVAAAGGMLVLTGLCRRGADPYAPIVDALADHIGRPDVTPPQPNGWSGLELLLPELAADGGSRGDTGQERRLTFHAVTSFLTTIAGDGRILLALDDLQWAGPDTADLLAHLARYASARVRIAIAYRHGELAQTDRLTACLADLARIDEVRRVRVESLDRAESEALVDAVAGGQSLDPVQRGRITRRAGGLPLFLVELTRAALDRSANGRSALGRAGDGIPANLRMAVAQQVAVLPAPALALLRRMSAIGTVVALDTLLDTLVAMNTLSAHDRLAERRAPIDRVVDALETCRRHGLLDETRHGYRFRYPLIHELLALGLGRNERRLWAAEADTFAAGAGDAFTHSS
jgi:transcriptional regulator with XRE-family HTH domain